MTIQGAMKQLEEMRDHPMMPVVFKPYFDKVIETIADEFAPTRDDIYWGYTATIDRPLADKEIVFRLRTIQKQIGGSYAIDRAIEVIEEVQELSKRHSHVAGGNKKDATDTNVGTKSVPSSQVDIVPVVRCKNCKWYGRADKRRFYRGMDCLQKRIDTIIPDKDFCSRAERREK